MRTNNTLEYKTICPGYKLRGIGPMGRPVASSWKIIHKRSRAQLNSSFHCKGLYKLLALSPTYHVCAVGSASFVGAVEICIWGVSSANPPGGSWEDPVMNCTKRASSSCVKLVTIVQNQSRVLAKERKRYQVIIGLSSNTFLFPRMSKQEVHNRVNSIPHILTGVR